ncbi:50S ribosomal protein L15 [Candidatus Woesearchaeota archaeon]|nr:MAG: 50S ribosomal protein L15 [Candidatus Woesearchaeota archaeon]
MTTHKRKKVVRYRASKTHGGGSMKKRRGAGHRGGRGNAGSGKRADTKKPSFVGRRFGKYGFNPRKNEISAMNLRHLEDSVETLVAKGVFTKSGDTYECDLSKIGVNKLLGTGKVTKKLNIVVERASSSATEKIEAAGGKVISTTTAHSQEAVQDQAEQAVSAE